MEPRLLIVTDKTLGPAGRAELAALASVLPERGIAVSWLSAASEATLAGELAPVPLELPPDLSEGLPAWLAGPIASIQRLSGRQEAEERKLEAALAAQHPTWVWIVTEADSGRGVCRQVARAARRLEGVQLWFRILHPVKRPEGFNAFGIDEEMAALVDHWLPTTTLEGRRLIEQRGVAPQNWSALPPCLPEQEARLKADGSPLRKVWGLNEDDLLVGAVAPGTEAELLLNALAAQEAPLKLALFLPPSERGHFSERAQALGVAEQVIFAEQPSLPAQAMAAFDLVALPQSAGAAVALEALLLGRPLLAGEHLGYEEFVEPGANGWLLPPSSEAWAEALAQLVANRRQREGMGLSGKERFFRLFDSERFAMAVADLLGRR